MRSLSGRTLVIGAAATALATTAGVAAAESDGDPKSTADSPLPFGLPGQSVLKGSNRKVFAHYFTFSRYPWTTRTRPPTATPATA